MNAKDQKHTSDVITRLRASLQEGSLLSSPGSQKTFRVLLCEREKMDEILTELNLETLAAAFQGEIIVPSIVQSMMSNEKIERLGVTAIGDRVRLRELCKEDEENNSRSSLGSRSVGSPSTSRTGDVP